MEKLIITRPDDWHLHLRTGSLLKTVLPHTARQFARAIVMPNLKPPVTTVAAASNYRDEILQALPEGMSFTPLMTLYLTGSTTVADVKAASEAEFIHAFKLYPAGATTNSDAGVSDLTEIFPVLEAMQKYAIPLLVHGEVVDPQVDIFDRERQFIETHLLTLTQQFPALRIVVEHLTTRDAVEFVKARRQTNFLLAKSGKRRHLLRTVDDQVCP